MRYFDIVYQDRKLMSIYARDARDAKEQAKRQIQHQGRGDIVLPNLKAI